MYGPRTVRLVIALLVTGMLAVSAPSSMAGGDAQPRPLDCNHLEHVHPSPTHEACLAASTSGGGSEGGAARDTFQLTDEPGNWFRSETTATPVTILDVGGRVDFVAGHETDTEHTATLVIKPVGSRLSVDQDDARNGGVASATFDVPGVYVFLCKVHPYMTGVVAVRDRNGVIPPVTAEQLPFIRHLGVESLPAPAVLDVLTPVAPADADKRAKWDILGPAEGTRPSVPGIGEVWVNTQFERVPGQVDEEGVAKPGSITVVDAASFSVEREVNGLDPDARGRWNNPHNMWSDTRQDIVYNGHWFGRWHNRIERVTGDVLETIDVGHAPTHTVTNPDEHSDEHGVLTLPLSAEQDVLAIRDDNGLRIIDSEPTGEGLNHPHGQWITADGELMVVPNVFKGQGVAGSISIMDLDRFEVVRELTDPAILMPVAAGIEGSSKAYVANIVSGQVTVIDLGTQEIVKNIPVTLTPDCRSGAQFSIFDTLQAPIQTPVSPDGRYVGVAVLSLTTVDRACTGSPDHVTIIDTATDTVVAHVGTSLRNSAGTHGANWGAKRGGGYYLYVANQHANHLGVVDPDPNGDRNGTDATLVGRVLLGTGPDVTDGVGGQGIKPLPNVYDGWIQDTVALSGQLNPEVDGWVAALTPCQRNPASTGC